MRRTRCLPRAPKRGFQPRARVVRGAFLHQMPAYRRGRRVREREAFVSGVRHALTVPGMTTTQVSPESQSVQAYSTTKGEA